MKIILISIRLTLLRIRLHMLLRKDEQLLTYNNSGNMYRDNDLMTKPMLVGCACGNAKVTKEWDDELGTYYCYYECEKCGYYWEGPIYTAL